MPKNTSNGSASVVAKTKSTMEYKMMSESETESTEPTTITTGKVLKVPDYNKKSLWSQKESLTFN